MYDKSCCDSVGVGHTGGKRCAIPPAPVEASIYAKAGEFHAGQQRMGGMEWGGCRMADGPRSWAAPVSTFSLTRPELPTWIQTDFIGHLVDTGQSGSIDAIVPLLQGETSRLQNSFVGFSTGIGTGEFQ